MLFQRTIFGYYNLKLTVNLQSVYLENNIVTFQSSSIESGINDPQWVCHCGANSVTRRSRVKKVDISGDRIEMQPKQLESNVGNPATCSNAYIKRPKPGCKIGIPDLTSNKLASTLKRFQKNE